MEKIKISNMEFIPNGMFAEFDKLIAKDDEERVETLYSRSAYGHDKKHMSKERVEIISGFSAYENRKPWMSKQQTEEFKYPCAQNINSKSEIGCFLYSSTNQNGHFGIPKLIFGRFGTNSYLDENGEFGVSDNCSAFVDTIDNLKLIKEALGSEEFKLINKMLNFSGINNKILNYIRINYNVIKLFRKDFYKYFI